jgi:hypothetical protein
LVKPSQQITSTPLTVRARPGWVISPQPILWLLVQPEDVGQAVGAQAGVLAGAPVVEDGHLLAGVGVLAVGDSVRLLGIDQADDGVAAVTEAV